ncbi:hypothetical protein F2Q69_00050982, partial [Brassica cretica]
APQHLGTALRRHPNCSFSLSHFTSKGSSENEDDQFERRRNKEEDVEPRSGRSGSSENEDDQFERRRNKEEDYLKMWSRGVGGVVREQKARLYIIRRCVVMLLCWHD